MNQKLTPVVIGLLAANIVIHVLRTTVELPVVQSLEPFFHLDKSNLLGFRGESFDSSFHWLQTLGSSFAHSTRGLTHLLFNMMALFMLGPAVETAMGSRRFLAFYLVSAIGGGIICAVFDPSNIPVIGASGAISGLLVAFAIYLPSSRLGLLFIPIFIPSRKFTVGFAAVSIALVVAGAMKVNLGMANGISHFGHLSGMIAGLLFLLALRATDPKAWLPYRARS